MTVTAEHIELCTLGKLGCTLQCAPGAGTVGGPVCSAFHSGVRADGSGRFVFEELQVLTAMADIRLHVSSMPPALSSVSSLFAVTAAAADRVDLLTPHKHAMLHAGIGFAVSAAILDRYGNRATDASGIVEMRLAKHNGTGFDAATSMGCEQHFVLHRSIADGLITFDDVVLRNATKFHVSLLLNGALAKAFHQTITVHPGTRSRMLFVDTPTRVPSD